MAIPVETLDGASLVLKREATLGDTLNGMLGVHADTFGAGASRPVIRGQTAPRVKVLSDGSELMDASGVSPDHAITSEPMLARHIEVLRGPATLRSEEHTSELQSLMRISYAVFCLKKKNENTHQK